MRWHPDEAIRKGDNIAISTGTREASAEAARATVRRAAGMLEEGRLAYKKIDSLLRGHAALEIVACLDAVSFDNVIIAPAFPALGRIMRGGMQFFRARDGALALVEGDLGAMLSELKLPVRRVAEGESLERGVSICDAGADADLHRIVALGSALPGRTLWCGTGGLAAAIGQLGGEKLSVQPVAGMLGIVGTAHPVIRGQIDELAKRAPEAVVRIESATAAAIDAAAKTINAAISRSAGMMATFDLAPHMDGGTLSDRAIGMLVDRLDTPSALFLAGGETCRRVCDRLGASSLRLLGQWVEGVPVSTLCGGRWDGIPLFSKSGAFGSRALLSKLFGKG